MEHQNTASSSRHSHFTRYQDPRSHKHSNSSNSAGSDNDTIYDAVRAGSSSAEEYYSRQQQHLQNLGYYTGSDMGGGDNIAMLLSDPPGLLPVSSSDESCYYDNDTHPRPYRYEKPSNNNRAIGHQRRSQTLPENWHLSCKNNDPLTELFKDAKAKVMNDLRWWGRGNRRRALSLGDADTHHRTARKKWAAALISPVRPLLPRYPPPVRSPTPPGVPSFGSPEAINYASRFHVRSSVPNGHGQQGHGQQTQGQQGHGQLTEPNRRATESYVHAFRRWIGLDTESTMPQANKRTALARAEDGTTVQGRFPYRASGHGSNLARQLEDHPFHRRAFPTAHSESHSDDMDSRRNTVGGDQLRRVRPRSAKVNTTARSNHQDANPNPNRTARLHYPRVLSSVPEPSSVPTFPQRPVPVLTSPGHNSYYSCMSQPRTAITAPTTYDGEISPPSSRTSGPYMSPQSLLQFPAVRPPEDAVTETTLDGTREPRTVWLGYEMYSLLTQYLFCCCLTDDEDDENLDGNDNDIVTASARNSAISGISRGDSRASRISRASNETFMTARSWDDGQSTRIDPYRRSSQYYPSHPRGILPMNVSRRPPDRNGESLRPLSNRAPNYFAYDRYSVTRPLTRNPFVSGGGGVLV